MIKLIQILFSPLSFLYGIVIGIRNFLFDKNIFKQTKVAVKIISVGNLTVGGSGKTPTVISLINMLKDKNKIGVLSRGYGRKSKGYLLVRNNEKILRDVETAGDEIYLVADECKIPAAVCEKRVEGARKFIRDINLDMIILDDAYQHRWIYRDINILVFDQRFLCKNNSIEKNLLPLGIMRERFNSINRADIIIINRKFSSKQNIPSQLWKYFINKKIFYSYYVATGIVDIKTHNFYPLNEFEGQDSLVLCGIAKPFSFIKALQENNINTKNKLIFKDHKNYALHEVEVIRKKFYETNSHSVLTTQKDAVKLSKFAKELDDIDIFYLKIEMKFEEEKRFLETINSLNKK
ncbi:MAG: tetraacyldisaccharide 4'-kinase [Ignavibacteriales bacterium]